MNEIEEYGFMSLYHPIREAALLFGFRARWPFFLIGASSWTKVALFSKP